MRCDSSLPRTPPTFSYHITVLPVLCQVQRPISLPLPFGSLTHVPGNIALGLEPQYRSPALLPQKGVPYSHPSFAETTKAALKGTMFYELHPQLWGKGIMSEAFTEVLRFAMEEVGVDVMVVSDGYHITCLEVLAPAFSDTGRGKRLLCVVLCMMRSLNSVPDRSHGEERRLHPTLPEERHEVHFHRDQ